MDPIYWYKQTDDKPLFPELVWSRPENKTAAGKLLIIGGHAQGFAAPAEAYTEAVKAGIGTAKVLLPDAVKKLIGSMLENGEFAPSTPSGSFSQKALAEFLDHSAWADSVLLAGDLGRNSETGIIIEKFLQKSGASVACVKDAADYAVNLPDIVLTRPDTLLVLTMAQLQKLGISARLPTAVTFGMDLLHLVETLHVLTEKYPVAVIVKHLSTILCSDGGKVCTMALETDIETWRIKAAAHAAVWQLQNRAKTFEAITTAVYSTFLSNNSKVQP